MRKNKYNELATTIMLITGLICIVFGIVVQFLLKDTNNVLNYIIAILDKYIIFAGIFCSLFSIIIMVARISRNNTIINLKSSGKLVYATNLRVWKSYYYGVDKKRWCHLLGEWEDPITHQKYEFRSDKLWVDIEPIIADKKIEKIPVYIDSNNPKIYFVDVDELTPTTASTPKSKKFIVGNIIFIILTIIIFSVCGILALLQLAPIKSVTDTQLPNNNEQITPDDQEENECAPFICYDGISDIESETLIPKANQINENLRKLLVLISLGDWESGAYTLQDIDKYALHSLIANRLFDEGDYLSIEIGVDNAILSSKDYENIFGQVTGIQDVKSYFADYELKDIKDYSSPKTLQDINNSKQYIFTESDNKTYYLVPFGVGMELGVYGVAVISDVVEQEDRTFFSIKTCEVDYDNNSYIHTKTTTFEIQTNGLRVYNFKVEKYN